MLDFDNEEELGKIIKNSFVPVTPSLEFKGRVHKLVIEEAKHRQRRTAMPIFHWSRVWTTVAIALFLAVIGFGLHGVLTPTETPPVVTQTNFRLLLSDEKNAIGDFDELHIKISEIGIQEGGESGEWHTFTLDPEADLDGDGTPGVDLRQLTGKNSIELWSGTLDDKEYTKLFIYVKEVIPVPYENVKLPSDKLQVSKPFTVSDSTIEFVFDITVIAEKVGQSGMYILQPHIDESGPDKGYVIHAGEDQDEIEFKDTIHSLDPLEIGDYTVIVDGDTEIKGELMEGLTAKVEGLLQEDGSVLALKIEVEEVE